MPQEPLDSPREGWHPVVSEELAQLDRVRTHLHGLRPAEPPKSHLHFDDELIELRDEVIEAKAEDIAPLAEQMMRVAAIRAARGDGGQGGVPVDPASPYFGHLKLLEDEEDRDIFIGKRSYINATAGVVIVDWRNAPISALYYRYDEGDDYDEHIAGRRREGLVTARRTLSVVEGDLRRVSAPQGVFVRESDGSFRKLDEEAARLRGGQGMALRPKGPAFVSRRKRQRHKAMLGEGGTHGLRPDKHLPEISALIDPSQFELITRDSEGILIVTGGAGSGKTTIGLHRIAFLAFQRPKRYRADRMLVVVPGKALASYIERVLPDLGLPGVGVRTLSDWLRGQRRRTLPKLTIRSGAESSDAVRVVKKHPAMLELIDRLVEEQLTDVREELAKALLGRPGAEAVLDATHRLSSGPLLQRLRALSEWVRKPLRNGDGRLGAETQAAVEAVLRRKLPDAERVVELWAELITDRSRLGALTECADGPTPGEIEQTVEACARQTAAVMDSLEAKEYEDEPPTNVTGVDHREESVYEAELSPEDDALLLRIHQRLIGELAGPRGQRLAYTHMMVDEVQDLSVVELAVLLRCVASDGSVTLAGDPAQRMEFDTGYEDWPQLMRALDLKGVEVSPLQIGYRSTAEIQRFARAVLGPEWTDDAPAASRPGVPVEAFTFGDPGEAVVFLADALRDLTGQEPLASVALIARYPEQAEMYYHALRAADVAGLRRVTEQDFSFAPGIEVTDVRQVKGLEFDYVLLLDVNAESYNDTSESRHLLHIAATRAAHQLWLICPGKTSPVLDDAS
ncbi:MAG: ATP-binding domain-containing protein [bacterium]